METKIKEPIIKEVVIKEPSGKFLIDETAACLRKMQTGNVDAFNELYDITKSYVYNIIKGVVNNPTDIEDIMQDVYIKVFNSYDSLKDAQAGLKWIKRIAYNKAVDFTKSSYKKNTSFVDEDKDYVFDEDALIAPMAMPEDIMDNAETQRLVGDILNNLPLEQLNVVKAFYFDELKTKEIAETFGMPEGTVKTYLYKARKTIEKDVLELAKKHGTKLFAVAFAPAVFKIFSIDAKACEMSTTASASVYKAAVLGSKAKDMGVSAVYKTGVSVKGVATAGIKAGASVGAKAGAAVAVKTGAVIAGKAIAVKIAAAVLIVGTITGGGLVAADAFSEKPKAQNEEIINAPDIADKITKQALSIIDENKDKLVAEAKEKIEEKKAEEENKAEEESKAAEINDIQATANEDVNSTDVNPATVDDSPWADDPLAYLRNPDGTRPPEYWAAYYGDNVRNVLMKANNCSTADELADLQMAGEIIYVLGTSYLDPPREGFPYGTGFNYITC